MRIKTLASKFTFSYTRLFMVEIKLTDVNNLFKHYNVSIYFLHL